ncbi:lipopolysaccharide core heptose(I) kinase RfaP [Schlesneria paludicola]|uniref:lipopolysaccharide core heptose(I) kinase RfaP n=1 Tax=Schlesneria paludicola TaxID=360056 RepID=UPI0012F8D307|nr:lipopolysaccharide core heptose(I) kinase RfaP [Schlesneria paludicola]
MSDSQLKTWDNGRLTVSQNFTTLLREHGWTSFDSVWTQTADAAVAKNVRTDRVTLRFTLNDAGTERAFYIKRHGRSSWKEYIKPLLRLTWPILGARNEWRAILDFQNAGIPTMTPVALGESGANSFLITEAIENCIKLSELGKSAVGIAESVPIDGSQANEKSRRRLIRHVAEIARKMHDAGLHHQDFYLGHLLLSPADESLFVIDLGRVRKQSPLSMRWIVKDLAQLSFSATQVTSATEQLRFLRDYFGRPLTRLDKRLIQRIQSKTGRIARHSRKNRL